MGRPGWIILLLAVLVAGCAPSGAPLPTLMPTAALLSSASSAQPQPTEAAVAAVETIPPPASPLATSPPATHTITPPPTFLPPLLPTFTITPTPAAARARRDDSPARSGPPSSTACDGTGFVYRGFFPSPVGSRSYRAYLPPCYGEDGRVYPVLYLIHGSVQTDSHWLDLGLAAQMDAAIADGRFPPFIVIMPYSGSIGNSTSGGPASVEGAIVNGLLPYVGANFCSWQSAAGRGIGGISRGGYWALEIAFQHPGLFWSVSGHSSHLRFETDGPTYNPLATYPNAAGRRIWLDWGEEDFLREGQEQLHNLLTEAGIDHRARVNPGGHSDSYWRAHLPAYLSWHAAAWSKDRGSYPACE